MAREYFCAYHSYRAWMKTLSDAEKGRLFDALLAYSESGEQLPLSGKEAALFPAMQWNIDRDKGKYEERCKQQSDNAKKRWDTKNAMACDGINSMPTDAKHATETEKEKDIKEKTPSESKRKPFCVPSLEEVRAYCRSRNSPVHPEAFHDYYTAKGWVVGRAPMKDWRAAVRNWERNEKPTASAEKEDPYADVIV